MQCITAFSKIIFIENNFVPDSENVWCDGFQVYIILRPRLKPAAGVPLNRNTEQQIHHYIIAPKVITLRRLS